MGCYIAPRNSSTIEDIAAAIRDRPYGADLLVAGNLNAKLADPEGTPRAEAIVYKLVEAGLVDMGLHFLPLPKSWLKDRHTWSMQQDGQEVWYQTDYILRTDRIFPDGHVPEQSAICSKDVVRPGHATPLGPLYGPEMSEEGASEGAHGIPTQRAPLPPPDPSVATLSWRQTRSFQISRPRSPSPP